MELKELKKDKRLFGFMLSINQDEAHSLIASLSLQLKNKSCDAGREEFTTKEGLYFSINVNQDKD